MSQKLKKLYRKVELNDAANYCTGISNLDGTFYSGKASYPTKTCELIVKVQVRQDMFYVLASQGSWDKDKDMEAHFLYSEDKSLIGHISRKQNRDVYGDLLHAMLRANCPKGYFKAYYEKGDGLYLDLTPCPQEDW